MRVVQFWIKGIIGSLIFLPLSLHATEYVSDVVVYGATPGGIIAAVAAAHRGHKVVIVEPSAKIGGIASGGLGASDVCRIRSIGGLAHRFFQNVGRKYGKALSWNFEPSVGEQVFREMLQNAKVEVHFGHQLSEVEKEERQIKRLKTNRGFGFAAKVFVDGSYEGDLLAKAKVSYDVGRDSREKYGEKFAGVQPLKPGYQFPQAISAYDARGRLLPGIQLEKLPPEGTGDEKVMAYGYRFCMTKKPENKVPFPEPLAYDPQQYELLARYLERQAGIKMEQMFKMHHMANGKYCINRNGPFSTNMTGENWSWPEANYEERRGIAQRHREFTFGLLKFLSTSERVPSGFKKEFSAWGLCKDEFVDTGNFPEQLYVREARRMIGEYVVTEHDLLGNNKKEDVIGLATCPIEVHDVQRVVTEQGHAANEGHLAFRVAPYAIPYRAVTPKRQECENLLVPVAVSASQVAYSSLRMEPVFMILGHSVGEAASLAIKHGTAVQDVDVKVLQELLRKRNQVL